MNKSQIISTLKQYDFNPDDYIVLSTGAMVMHGIKDSANDIDLAVSERLYNELLEKYDCACFEYESNGKMVKYCSFENFDFGLNYFDKENVDIVCGIPIQSISSILDLKRKLNRDKDINDIKLIEEYMYDNR